MELQNLQELQPWILYSLYVTYFHDTKIYTSTNVNLNPRSKFNSRQKLLNLPLESEQHRSSQLYQSITFVSYKGSLLLAEFTISRGYSIYPWILPFLI